MAMSNQQQPQQQASNPLDYMNFSSNNAYQMNNTQQPQMSNPYASNNNYNQVPTTQNATNNMGANPFDNQM